MTDPTSNKPSPVNWLWIAMLVALLVVVILWFVNPLGKTVMIPPSGSTAPSTDWEVQPTGKAVPVNLPTVQVGPVSQKPSSGKN